MGYRRGANSLCTVAGGTVPRALWHRGLSCPSPDVRLLVVSPPYSELLGLLYVTALVLVAGTEGTTEALKVYRNSVAPGVPDSRRCSAVDAVRVYASKAEP